MSWIQQEQAVNTYVSLFDSVFGNSKVLGTSRFGEKEIEELKKVPEMLEDVMPGPEGCENDPLHAQRAGSRGVQRWRVFWQVQRKHVALFDLRDTRANRHAVGKAFPERRGTTLRMGQG